MTTAPLHDRLARLEKACEQIWPAIRFFGLCGADPRYVAAMIEIGELIGEIRPTPAGTPATDPRDLIAAAKIEAQQQIAQIIADSPEFREGIGRNLQIAFAEKIRKLQFSSE